jgi:hypothetical protein
MILGWSSFKIVSVSAVLYPRWPPFLKIEISSNGTQFWERTTQESFQQSLVDIGSVVSEEKIFFKFHPPFFDCSLPKMCPAIRPFDQFFFQF